MAATGSYSLSSTTSGGGKWRNSKGETGQYVSELKSKRYSPKNKLIGNYGSRKLQLTIDLDNGKSEKFTLLVRNSPPLFWISENESSEHVFASDGALVSISYAQDEEQYIITVKRDGEELVLQEEGLSFKTLPKKSIDEKSIDELTDFASWRACCRYR